MSRTKKVIIGTIAFLPLFLVICILVFGFSLMFNSIRTESLLQENGSNMITEYWNLEGFFALAAFIIIAIILQLVLLIYFIIHIINNKRVKNEERIIWVLLFIFVSTIAYPIYWGIRIWPDEKPESNFVKM